MSPSKQTILVTGGCGYIGSHTVLRLLESGYKVIVVDNLSNSSYESLRRVHKLYAATAAASPSVIYEDASLPVETLIPFYKVDILDRKGLVKVFEDHPEISSVIHFAGRKAVGESGRIPLDYYNVNISGTVNLLQVMEEFHVRKIVFSSSATVYGDPPSIPIPEESPINSSMSPYGRTKVFLEHIIKDLCVASVIKQQQYLQERAAAAQDANAGNGGADLVERNYEWSAMLLRYFNPAGAHPSGIMGEDCMGTPNNLMPFLSQVAVGKLERLAVFGNDYPTEDGTCIRDYLHVVDLAQGHVAALAKLDQEQAAGNYGCKAYNLGTGTGYSVFDMIKAFSKAVGTDLPYKVTDRRPGDVPNLTSDPRLANKVLNWRAEKTLDEMCADLWRWQRNNPDGYAADTNTNPPSI